MTDIKCPKCGSRSFRMVEQVVSELAYDVKDGIIFTLGRGDDTKHVRTDCACRDCGYKWHPRKGEYIVDF